MLVTMRGASSVLVTSSVKNTEHLAQYVVVQSHSWCWQKIGGQGGWAVVVGAR